MTFSVLCYLGVCLGMYWLGTFNQKYPGELARNARLAWTWLRARQHRPE